jgi:hypothetical protein
MGVPFCRQALFGAQAVAGTLIIGLVSSGTLEQAVYKDIELKKIHAP